MTDVAVWLSSYVYISAILTYLSMVNQCITISFFQKLHVIGEISKVLNTHAPKKVKIIRGNHKPHYNKNLRKAFIKRSRLKNKTNRSKDPVDIANYKKQRNLVVSLNRQAKSKYFNEDSNTESSRPFWETCKPYFSNKHARGDSKIMLIENDKMLLKNEEVAKEFNQYFGHITDSLDLYEFPDVSSAKD